MAVTLAAFIFATVGAKLVLALVAIYYLLPGDRRCAVCDEETLALTARRGFATLQRLLRLRRRWCPRCGAGALARDAASRAPVGPVTPAAVRRAG